MYKVDLVVHGSTPVDPDSDGQDPYELPKELGIYREIESSNGSLLTERIIERIFEHRKL